MFEVRFRVLQPSSLHLRARPAPVHGNLDARPRARLVGVEVYRRAEKTTSGDVRDDDRVRVGTRGAVGTHVSDTKISPSRVSARRREQLGERVRRVLRVLSSPQIRVQIQSARVQVGSSAPVVRREHQHVFRRPREIAHVHPPAFVVDDAVFALDAYSQSRKRPVAVDVDPRLARASPAVPFPMRHRGVLRVPSEESSASARLERGVVRGS